jgi:DNA-binding response OmpR family regulator
MEPLDGLAVVGAIRTSAKAHMVKIPIVIFSATDDDSVMRTALQAGATGAIPKPFNPKGMAEYLRGIIRRKEHSSDHLEEFRAVAKLDE